MDLKKKSLETKNINNIKNIIDVMKNLDGIDNKLERKFNNNNEDLKFYKELINETKNNFLTIIKNLN